MPSDHARPHRGCPLQLHKLAPGFTFSYANWQIFTFLSVTCVRQIQNICWDKVTVQAPRLRKLFRKEKRVWEETDIKLEIVSPLLQCGLCPEKGNEAGEGSREQVL